VLNYPSEICVCRATTDTCEIDISLVFFGLFRMRTVKILFHGTDLMAQGDLWAITWYMLIFQEHFSHFKAQIYLIDT